MRKLHLLESFHPRFNASEVVDHLAATGSGPPIPGRWRRGCSEP